MVFFRFVYTIVILAFLFTGCNRKIPSKTISINPSDICFVDINMIESVYKKHKDDLNLTILENDLEEILYIKNAEVFRDVRDSIAIDITQRTPIARFFSNKKSFYIDDSGVVLPFTKKCSIYTLLILGENSLKLIQDSTFIEEKKYLIDYILYLQDHKFLRYQIDHLSIDYKMQLKAYPYVGDNIIFMGKIDENLIEKSTKIVYYYKYIFSRDLHPCKYIDMRYSNQIICR